MSNGKKEHSFRITNMSLIMYYKWSLFVYLHYLPKSTVCSLFSWYFLFFLWSHGGIFQPQRIDPVTDNYRSLLRTKHYDKRDDFNLPIVNFPCICSSIPAASAYIIDISQMADLRSLPWLVYQLRNICVTDVHRYVQLFGSFLIHDLSSGLLLR
jgi:hypothetical protein